MKILSKIDHILSAILKIEEPNFSLVAGKFNNISANSTNTSRMDKPIYMKF